MRRRVAALQVPATDSSIICSTNIAFPEYDPSFDTLRDDARFATLVKPIGLRKRKDL